jgi:hypothetical protein
MCVCSCNQNAIELLNKSPRFVALVRDANPLIKSQFDEDASASNHNTVIPFSSILNLFLLSTRITHVIASTPFDSVQMWWRQSRNLLARIRGTAALRVLLQRLSWLLQHTKRNGWI